MSQVSERTASSPAATARSGRHLPVLSTGLGLGGIDVVGAEGVWFHLADGRRVIDASNTAAPLGHRHPGLVAAAQKAADSPALNEGWAWPGRQQAADDLLATVFGEEQDWVGAVRFFNSASEANDQALSLAQALTGRSALVTRERAYHGMVGLSREMTVQPQWHGGLSSLHGGWRPAPRLADVRQLPAPRCGVYSPCAQDGCECLPAGLSGQFRDVAAVIIDYSQGGIYPSPAYQDTIARAAREAGALWIADEVVTGLGRQGRWLTLQRGTERPDIVTLGKGLAGGAAPAAAVVLSTSVTDQLVDQLWQSYSTFRGHPLSVAAISATVTGIAQQGLVSQADSFDAVLRPWMTAIGGRHPSVERVDGLGLHWTVELRGAQRWREWHSDTSERTIADSVVTAALESGVLIATSAEEASLFVAPPLVVSPAELEKILDALDRGLSVADRILGS
jgi:4-aminobutyrate aminotransferase-like enzyme